MAVLVGSKGKKEGGGRVSMAGGREIYGCLFVIKFSTINY